MFENISGIKIIGGCFQPSSSPLLFFPKNGANGKSWNARTTALIYGSNGAGKSSIANALIEYKNNKPQLFSKVELLVDDGSSIDKSTLNLGGFYIFNEQFINKNVRITEDGKLNAIVLLGEMASLTDRINILKLRKEKFQNQLTIFQDELNKLSDPSDITSSYYHKNKISSSLRSVWAENERVIRGIRKAADVNDRIVNDIINAPLPNKGLETLKQEYINKLADLKKAKEHTTIETPVKLLSIDDRFDQHINKLLATVIVKPEFNEREQAILNMLEKQENATRINEIKTTFSNSETIECPYCFQSVNEDYKITLLQSITTVFDSQDAKQHRLSLDELDLTALDIDLEAYRIIDETLVDTIYAATQYYNGLMKGALSKVEQKKNNIYTPITDIEFHLVSERKEINKHLTTLENKRKAFNNAIDSTEVLKNELQTINKDIAIIELKDEINYYSTCKKIFDDKSNQTNRLKKILERLTTRIGQFEGEKNNIHLAIPLINRYLSYIFFAPERLKIELEDNKYAIKVRGNNVSSGSLSEGEINALALCYFFSSLLINKEEKDFFKDECFIVLDDPISSLDFNNKVGIYTFLRYMLNKIHAGNKNSRALILTHQIESIFHLEKVCGDISQYETDTTKIYPSYFILQNHQLNFFPLDERNKKKHHEYQFIINKIFDYANKEAGSHLFDDSIGNSMRRLIESFSFFNYRKRIEEFFRDDEILELIQNDNKQEYFRNLMGRLILNNESHYQDQTLLTTEFDFSYFITPDEKRNTAQAVLILLKLLNPLHLKSYLEDSATKLAIIEQWENKLFPT